MANRPQGEIDWHDCAQQLEDYTSAEIEFVVNEAARHALSQNRPIVTGDILQAAGNNPPAYSGFVLFDMPPRSLPLPPLGGVGD